MNLTNGAAVAAMLMITMFGAAVAPTDAAAQTRAALVQNVDEQGRNPYQEHIDAVCNIYCIVSFNQVPAGMRLVVTHVNLTVDTLGGTTVPRVLFESNSVGRTFAVMALPVARGTALGGTYQMIANEDVLAYFGPGEQPTLYGALNLELYSSSDRFAGPLSASISGYYVKLP